MSKKESAFQRKIIDELQQLYPNAIIMKNDPTYIQGIPDIVMLEKDCWIALETKRAKDSPKQPNQDYYINKMNDMSYASFIYPENKEEVFNGIQSTLQAKR